MPFQGEMMTCIVCGRQERSNPAVKSDWRMLDADGYHFYFCPDEFPSNKAGKEAFSEAYQIAITICTSEIAKRQGKLGIEPAEKWQEYRRLERSLKVSLPLTEVRGFRHWSSYRDL